MLDAKCWWFAKHSRNEPDQTACLEAAALTACPEILQSLWTRSQLETLSCFPDNSIFHEYARTETLEIADVSQTKSVIAKVIYHLFFCRWWMLMRTKWGLLSPERSGRKWEGQWAGHQNIRSKRPLKDDKETQRQMKASAYFLYLLLENKRGKSCLLKTILKSERLEHSNYTHFPLSLNAWPFIPIIIILEA